MLLGRRRRYFGYPKDLTRVVDTPESAKSYASVLAPIESQTRTRYDERCTYKAGKSVSNRFADKHLHAAIASEIPALLPPLKNTFRFQEYEDNPMKFHPPQFEHHFQRALYYIWLSKNDRHELCDIVDSHLGTRHRRGLHHKLGEYREIGNPMHRLPPPDYSRMPRRHSILDDESPASKNLKSRFQKGNWDPPKTPRDRFVRDHGNCPALEAICRDYPPDARTRVTEKDVRECLLAAKRLLGPYAGINTNFTTPEDIPVHILEQIADEDILQREKDKHQKDDPTTKRPFGYISSQIKYEKQIASAMDYYNKLKSGNRLPTPPPDVFIKHEEHKRRKSGRHSKHSRTFTRESLPTNKIREKSISVGDRHKPSISFTRENSNDLRNGNRSASDARRLSLVDKVEGPPKRKFNKDNITEEDYMAMYIHFLGSDHDLTAKKPAQTMTDVSKLRKKMHLDPNSEDENEGAIEELVKSDSFSDIKDPVVRKIMKGEINPLKMANFTPEDVEILETILKEHYDALPEIRELRETFSQFSVHELLEAVSKSKTNIQGTLPTSPIEDKEFDGVDLENFEREFGFIDKTIEKVEIPLSRLATEEDGRMSIFENSPESELSPVSTGLSLGIKCECDPADLECLSDIEALGEPPFGNRRFSARRRLLDEEQEQDEDNNSEDPELSMFAREHWINK